MEKVQAGPSEEKAASDAMLAATAVAAPDRIRAEQAESVGAEDVDPVRASIRHHEGGREAAHVSRGA
jgi:hypothetical protein